MYATVADLWNGTGDFISDFLDQPAGILVDSNGNFYIADSANSANSRIQYWLGSVSFIRTIAGNGKWMQERMVYLCIILSLWSAGNLLNQLDNLFDTARACSDNHCIISCLSGASSGTCSCWW